VEKAADTRMARAIGVDQLAILPHAASSPDAYFWLRGQFARRQFDHHREDVGLGIGVDASPRRLATQVRRGEIPLAPDVEQILDAVEIEKESVAAAAGEERVVARLDEVGLGAKMRLLHRQLSSYRQLRQSAPPRP